MLPQLNVQIIVVQFELLSINQLIIIRLNNRNSAIAWIAAP